VALHLREVSPDDGNAAIIIESRYWSSGLALGTIGRVLEGGHCQLGRNPSFLVFSSLHVWEEWRTPPPVDDYGRDCVSHQSVTGPQPPTFVAL